MSKKVEELLERHRSGHRDFRGADLKGADLSGANLRGSDFREANLGANLDRADLSTADLRKVNLSCANLHNANLSMADMHRADLSGADLSESDLSEAILSCANLHNANLRYANLSKADLGEAILSGADLRKADLSGANLSMVVMSGAILSRANLSGATGLLSSVDFLRKFDKDDKGILVFKRIPENWNCKTPFDPPAHWKIEAGSVLTEVCNPDRCTDCGCGVNFGTLDWCNQSYLNADLWLCRIDWYDLSGVVVPYNTEGKARCERLTLLSRIPTGLMLLSRMPAGDDAESSKSRQPGWLWPLPSRTE